MLETGNLGAQVRRPSTRSTWASARAAGLPGAADVYGVRVAKSQFGYRSLGAGNGERHASAQHCRAEVYLTGFGWVPVDPADVRKVVLEEKAQPTDLSDPLVQAVRPRLFGRLGDELARLQYRERHRPAQREERQADVLHVPAGRDHAQGRLDSLDPDNFKYTMTAKEVSA